MDTIINGGNYEYVPVDTWEKLPDGWALGEVAAVAIDRFDNVYVFNRGDHPMIVLDKDGNFLRSWGEGVFARPHGLHIDANDTVYCTDDFDHCVRRYSLQGELLLVIGTPGKSSGAFSGSPFASCTHTATTLEGDVLVTDGYHNARVHRYSTEGRLLTSWGQPGSGPGEFNFPHNIVVDPEGWTYVADRENHRIQVFDGWGRYEAQWGDLHRPSAIYRATGAEEVFYVGELAPYLDVNRGWPNVGPRVSVLSPSGELIGRLDSAIALGPGVGRFVSPHGLAVDSQGDIYIGDVSNTAWPALYPDRAVPAGLRPLHKFRRVAVDTGVR